MNPGTCSRRIIRDHVRKQQQSHGKHKRFLFLFSQPTLIIFLSWDTTENRFSSKISEQLLQ